MLLRPTDLSMYPTDAIFPEFNPAVLIDEAAFDDALIDKILTHIKTLEWAQSGVYSSDGSRSISTLRSSFFAKNVDATIIEDVMSRLDLVIDRVIEGQAWKPPCELRMCYAPSFLKYDESNQGHFNAHTDNAYILNDEFIYPYPERLISVVVYLNDDFTGGEVVFPNILLKPARVRDRKSFTYTPKAGSAILFPSDLRYPHSVSHVTQGTRYCIVAWYGWHGR